MIDVLDKVVQLKSATTIRASCVFRYCRSHTDVRPSDPGHCLFSSDLVYLWHENKVVIPSSVRKPRHTVQGAVVILKPQNGHVRTCTRSDTYQLPAFRQPHLSPGYILVETSLVKCETL